jgi:hypothetical protein
MKKRLFSVAALVTVVLAVMAFNLPSGHHSNQGINPPQDQAASVFPENVQKIFETSCYDCHSDLGSNAKAKMKVNFSNWSELSDSKKIAKMENINEEISKGDMPPAKYQSNYPDRVPGKEQKEIISKWVTEETAKLMGK